MAKTRPSIRRILLLPLLLLGHSLLAQQSYNDLNKNGKMDPYENPALLIDQRIDDLLGLMTLEEKLGQLQMTMSWGYYEKQGDNFVLTEACREAFCDRHIGCIWALMRADPWTQKTLDNGITPDKAYALVCTLQQHVRQHTRLGIPILIAEECPHGHMSLGTTVFPTAIGRASTFNPELEFRIGQCVGQETWMQGAHIAFGPVLDIARDPRWSRYEETYGEDPVLSGTMGGQYAAGLQSSGVISTLKHFTAYGVSEGGHNGNSAIVGTRELLSVLSQPFRTALAAGAGTLMTSYNDVDGIPSSANRWLLHDVLRQQWGFNGWVISDLYAINGLVSARMAADYSEAAALAALAGVNVDLGASCYGEPLRKAILEGKVSEARIDELLRPVLATKFQLGLFDNPFNTTQSTHADPELARRAAEESVILLKNDNNLLPLSKTLQRIAVIGPNADNAENMLGDYTAPQAPDDVVTVLQGIRHVAPQATIEYVKGCHVRDTTWSEIESAVNAAARADVVVVVLGGSSARTYNTSYEQTGAANASTPAIGDMDAGEGFDRATLKLLGRQEALLRAIVEIGKPVVLVLIQGRPLDLTWADAHVPAILNAWYPGAQGGEAVARILFGEVNPSGKLPVSYPQSVGQLPVYYNSLDERRSYTDGTAMPLYPFGHGLSYSQFAYHDLQTPRWLSDTTAEVTFQLTNRSARAGAEVVQLYLRDDHASVKLPERQLKQFQKITLDAGETRNVTFILTRNDFELLNSQLHWVIEPGSYTVLIGSSSQDIRLEGKLP